MTGIRQQLLHTHTLKATKEEKEYRYANHGQKVEDVSLFSVCILNLWSFPLSFIFALINGQHLSFTQGVPKKKEKIYNPISNH